MANQLGLRLHVAPGRGAHRRLARARAAGRAGRGGGVLRHHVAVLGGRRAGCSTPPTPLALMITGRRRLPGLRPRLVVVENTHNFGGGTVQPLDADPRRCAPATQAPRGRACTWTVPGSGTPTSPRASALAAYGARVRHRLGLPVARASAPRSARCSSAVARGRWRGARIWRKRYGGGMRQAGILAAGRPVRPGAPPRPAGRRPRPGPVASPQAVAKAAPEVVDPRPGRDQHRDPGRGRGRVDRGAVRRRGRRARGADVRHGRAVGADGVASGRGRRRHGLRCRRGQRDDCPWRPGS